MDKGASHDIIILGGGLAGGLTALALAQRRPELSVLLIERGEELGGNHIWSFFATDIDPADADLIEPLIECRWDAGYTVRFPKLQRVLTTPYRSITSERLDAALRAAMPAGAILTGTTVVAASQTSVTLADQRTIRAGAVIDARGAAGLPGTSGGWQKFLGQMVRLDAPHGLTRPVVMDARVDQRGGYRFVYVLPFSADTLFVEDTYYADDAGLDLPLLRQRIEFYCRAHGWEVAEVLREETGVLPVIAAGDLTAGWADADRVPARIGARAGLLHPVTSYSLPDAVRSAAAIAAARDISGAALAKASYKRASAHWRRGSFYRMLSTMLFGAASPGGRYRVLERFYRLPEPLIERFYAGRSTLADKVRILSGRPPVRIGRALASLTGMGPKLSRLDPPGDHT